ncbi:variable surface protein [Plasmodium gonderi]|uniref:Variable surface protein n=1 Tax=Plasmodium gonderi TaxID=77519 RepID=A0A1Y1JRR0_PLAGO|nr:variable surface protein [Plasmodium gonderi]GAW84165.1 variable surface protein [Plasmodium gonderi]
MKKYDYCLLKLIYFDIKGIFPTCSKDFTWDKEATRRESDAHNFTILCSDFYNQVSHGRDTTQFSKLCRVLGLYLNHLERRSNDIDVKSCCELFYYKLEKELIPNFELKCNEPNECYKKMIEQKRSTFETKISNICMEYSGNIEQDTSELLNYLFKIYYYIDLFKNPQVSDTGKMRLFKGEIEHLENYDCKSKRRLKAELEKIIEICQGYINSWTLSPRIHAAKLLTDSWMKTRRMKIQNLNDQTFMKNGSDKVINNVIAQTEALEFQPLMDTMTGGDTHTGISVGIIFITFSILIIIFILYKYTSYFSFIKPSVWKLTRKLNKNKNNNLDFMYSFHDKYKIAYS